MPAFVGKETGHKRIESILFTGMDKTLVCQGNFFEKWIQRRAKKIVEKQIIVAPPPPALADLNVEADIKQTMTVDLTHSSFALVDTYCEDLSSPYWLQRPLNLEIKPRDDRIMKLICIKNAHDVI